MLLNTLTYSELERLAYVEPDRPGVGAALSRRLVRELDRRDQTISVLEDELDSLQSIQDDDE